MTNKVYVIVREEGEYSDYGMEVVKAVATEQAAKDFVQHANIIEQIKLDKEQETRKSMIEWNKENPFPGQPSNILLTMGSKWR